MRKHVLTGLIIICFSCIGTAQYTKKAKHPIRPGVSISYLPTWVIDDYDGNVKGAMALTGVHAYKEIGKESFFSLGLMYGKYKDDLDEQQTGFILPIRLHKFFVEEREGFNLGFGLWMNYCATCNGTIGGTFSQEINYMFFGHPLRVNVGIQTMLGNLFTDTAVQVGPQLQLLWVPEPKQKR